MSNSSEQRTISIGMVTALLSSLSFDQMASVVTKALTFKDSSGLEMSSTLLQFMSAMAGMMSTNDRTKVIDAMRNLSAELERLDLIDRG